MSFSSFAAYGTAGPPPSGQAPSKGGVPAHIYSWTHAGGYIVPIDRPGPPEMAGQPTCSFISKEVEISSSMHACDYT